MVQVAVLDIKGVAAVTVAVRQKQPLGSAFGNDHVCRNAEGTIIDPGRGAELHRSATSVVNKLLPRRGDGRSWSI